MAELLDPAGLREEVEEEIRRSPIFPEDIRIDPSLEVEENIEREIKEATGITALEDEQARLDQESAAQRKEFASLLEEAEGAETEASKAAELARRRRRAGATRQSTRVARRTTTPGATSRTNLGG